ncbi:MAG: SWIM zinc finger family protein [Saccharothrix sp.]|nr:SWIM zinc finger family protein [Saccharothrix sp.]
MTAVQTYAYLRESAVHEAAAGPALDLATSGGWTPDGPAANPSFFTGFLTAPTVAAPAILAVADIAAARYFQPRRAASLDPVVTGDGGCLRLESFSGCCGVYARLDILPAGLDGGDVGRGTTNVDVNEPLRRALAMIGGLDPLHLAVGPHGVEATTFDGRFVEKKVPLPDRWVRGFAEAQVAAAGFTPRAELSGPAASAFLRALPRPTTTGRRTVRLLVPDGKTLRPAIRPVAGALSLAGPERLDVLRRVLRHLTGLRVYAPDAAPGVPTATAWEALLPGMRLTLMHSPEASRGFSGEGGVLDDLATRDGAADADAIAELLAWEPRIDVADLSAQSGLPESRVRAALTVLGVSGQVGYDLADNAYFHRHLPFAAGDVERHNPRLRGARRLVEARAVCEVDGVVRVGTGEHEHLVLRGDDGVLSCTCLWWAKYRGGRGPCKHVLAAQLVGDTTTTDPVTGEAR